MPIKMSKDWRLKRRTIRHPSFDPDESITIKSYYGDHDRQRVLSASTEYRRDGEDGAVYIVATLDKLHAVKRELAVISWNLKDEDGNPLPFSREVLLQLPSEIAEWLDSEINKDWDDLGEPQATSAEDAERIAKEVREETSTFPRDGLPAVERTGKAPSSRRNEYTPEGDIGPRRAEAQKPAPVEGIRDQLLGSA